MSPRSTMALWLSRVALAAAGLVLLLIAAKFIAQPVAAAAASNIHLGSSLAITNMRASFGAFPLGCALVAFGALTSRRYHVGGLAMVGAVLGSALIVRVYGVVVDGTLAESRTVLVAEAFLFGLCLSAILAAHLSSRHGNEAAVPASMSPTIMPEAAAVEDGGPGAAP